MRPFLLFAPLLLTVVGCEAFAQWLGSGGADTAGGTVTTFMSLLPPPFNLLAEGTGGILTLLLTTWAGKKGYDKVKGSIPGSIFKSSP